MGKIIDRLILGLMVSVCGLGVIGLGAFLIWFAIQSLLGAAIVVVAVILTYIVGTLMERRVF
jgi:hypothetical protein